MPPKKNGKKKNGKSKIPRNKLKAKPNQLFLKRTYLAIIPQAGAGGVNTATASNYWFSIGGLSGISEVTNLFQKVYLMSVDVTFIPKATNSQTSAVGTESTTLMWAFNGNNDQTGIPTHDTMMQNSMTKYGNITKGFKQRIFPVVKMQMGSSGVTTYYSQKPSRQVAIDANSLLLKHYGLDWFIPDTNLAHGTILGSFKLTYNILAKNPI